jgi:hypothetical protein
MDEEKPSGVASSSSPRHFPLAKSTIVCRHIRSKKIHPLHPVVERRSSEISAPERPKPLPRSSPTIGKPIHMPSGSWLVIISAIVSGLSRLEPPERRLRINATISGKVETRPVPNRGRDSGKEVPIDITAHGGVYRPKVVSTGRYRHVFHRRPLSATAKCAHCKAYHLATGRGELI